MLFLINKPQIRNEYFAEHKGHFKILTCFLYLRAAAIIGSSIVDTSFNKFWSMGIFSSLTILLK